MRTNTLITLGASAVFGILAIILTRGWIEDAIQDEFNQVPANPISATLVPKTPMVSVVVANSDLSFGDEITPNVLRVIDIPEDAVPLQSMERLSDVFPVNYDPANMGAVIALDDIRMNEIVLPHRISGLNGRKTLSARIRPGYRAVSIPVDDITGVAGFIVPGDLVDVQYLSEAPSSSDKSVYRSDVLLQSVRVIGVDQSQNQNKSTAEVARTVTLEVSHMDAQALAVAHESGTLSLVLRAVGETLPSTTKSLDSRQLDLRVNSNSSAKKPRTPVQVTPKNPAPAVAEITVIRGDTTQSVSVRREPRLQTDDTTLAGG